MMTREERLIERLRKSMDMMRHSLDISEMESVAEIACGGMQGEIVDGEKYVRQSARSAYMGTCIQMAEIFLRGMERTVEEYERGGEI